MTFRIYCIRENCPHKCGNGHHLLASQSYGPELKREYTNTPGFLSNPKPRTDHVESKFPWSDIDPRLFDLPINEEQASPYALIDTESPNHPPPQVETADSAVSSTERVDSGEYEDQECPHCGNVYTGKWGKRNCARHQKDKHGDTGEQTYSCGNCDKGYRRTDALRKHERQKHSEVKQREVSSEGQHVTST